MRDRLPAIATLALVCAAVLQRLTALSQPPGIDQGIFLTAAWAMRRGFDLYADVWDQKPPGIHLTYRGALAVLGERPEALVWLDTLAFAATCAVLFALVRGAAATRTDVRPGPAGRSAMWLPHVTVATYALLALPGGLYSYGGFLERAVPETFIALLAAASALCAARLATRYSDATAAVFGMTVGLAVVFKPTAAIYGPAFLAAASLIGLRTRLGRAAAVSSIGAFLAPAAVVLWLWAQGTHRDAWIAVVDYNRAYVFLDLHPATFALAFARAIWMRARSLPVWFAGGAGAALVLLAFVRRRNVPAAVVIGFCWLTAALASAAAGGIRLFNNYFTPALPPLALLAAWSFLGGPFGGRAGRACATAMVLLALVLGHRGGYIQAVARTTASDAAALVRTEPAQRLAYLERFGGYGNGRGYSARANAELAKYLRAHTLPHHSVYIFGMQPGVYFAAARPPAHRFIWVSPVVFGSFEHTEFTLRTLVDALEREPPEYFVFERNNWDSRLRTFADPALEDAGMRRFLAMYVEEAAVEDFRLFRRRVRR